jgi:hypothetical protein
MFVKYATEELSPSRRLRTEKIQFPKRDFKFLEHRERDKVEKRSRFGSIYTIFRILLSLFRYFSSMGTKIIVVNYTEAVLSKASLTNGFWEASSEQGMSGEMSFPWMAHSLPPSLSSETDGSVLFLQAAIAFRPATKRESICLHLRAF